MSWVRWVRIQQGAENICCLLAILRGTEPVSALTHALVYLFALNDFLFLEFCQLLSRADRVYFSA